MKPRCAVTSIRQYLSGVTFLLLMFGGTLGPVSAKTESLRVNFAADDKLPDDRFALFIGIDKYPLVKTSCGTADLAGCVNDALNLRTLFVERFGFKRHALLTNTQASGKGIYRQRTSSVSPRHRSKG